MPRETRARVRQRVVEAAAEVFAEKGIAAARVEDVAAAAGFTRGAVYSNFAGKPDLVAAVVADAAARLAVSGAAVFDPAHPPGAVRAALTALVVDRVEHHTRDSRLALELLAHATRDERLRAGVLEPRRRSRGAIAEALTRYCAARGLDLPLPADVVATTLVAVVDSYATERLVDPAGTDPDTLRRALDALLPG
ncbi:TetR/AcrR family transcriptional regulator [Actinokineospora bangkokensis]|uniref:HTH tetR-type domain-containing protein n=1 Tax=Actinokineospora bangkokensis TaxID=1193682 RepID=A0A1Q9LJL2_9PSEU|nr:TetR family transcriptional regulator [Actinokineospora bangkokensis]OLR92169.1 hypothetical protein BJP25_22825 [Actinokineospora bangkokensis]